MALHFSWVFAFGLLGNLISCMVCLAPLPTFYQIWKKKTSEGFQSIPYVIALFSAMLWLFYAIFQKDTTLLITINSFTFFMEVGYIAVYLFYGTKKDRIVTFKLFLLLNVFGFGVICILALSKTHGLQRVKLLGWICMIFALCVFVAPLCILVPNILGCLFGIIQMVLYVVYRKHPKKIEVNEPKIQELSETVIDVAKLSATICSELNGVAPQLNDINGIEVIEVQIVKEPTQKITPGQELDVTNKV